MREENDTLKCYDRYANQVLLNHNYYFCLSARQMKQKLDGKSE